MKIFFLFRDFYFWIKSLLLDFQNGIAYKICLKSSHTLVLTRIFEVKDSRIPKKTLRIHYFGEA